MNQIRLIFKVYATQGEDGRIDEEEEGWFYQLPDKPEVGPFSTRSQAMYASRQFQYYPK